MMTATNEKAHSISLRKAHLFNIIATIVAALALLGSCFWTVFDAEKVPLIVPTFYFSASFISAFLILGVVNRVHPTLAPLITRYRTAWTFIALGLLACGPGGPLALSMHTIIENTHQPGLVFVVVLSLLFYPFTFIGMVFLSGTDRWRIGILLDALVMMLCILCFCWFLVTNTITPSSTTSDFTTQVIHTTLLTYPGNDLFLFYILLPLIFREKDWLLRIPLYMMGVALLCLLWAHSATVYLAFTTDGYQPGTFYIDWFWQFSFILIGLAVLYQYAGLLRRSVQEQKRMNGLKLSDDLFKPSNQKLPWGWRAIRIIHLPFIILFWVFLINIALHSNTEMIGFMVLCSLVGLLISIRYFYSARANDSFLSEKEQRYQEAERVRRLISQLSDIRNLERLRERVVSVLLTEPGFISAMLLLVEDDEQERTNQTYLSVTLIMRSKQISRWRVLANHNDVFFHTAVSGQRTTLDLASSPLPTELRAWPGWQQMPRMVFFPISYRDRHLGSLGIAQNMQFARLSSETAVIRQYTEQLAPILEHAYLYHQARDRGTFAQAMVNISTRLNASVIDQKEIGQLICEEGLKALKANFVVLYAATPEKQFQSLATSTDEEFSSAMSQQWPSFALAEYEEEAEHSLEPFLLPITQRRKTGEQDTGPLPTLNGHGEKTRESFGPRLFALRARLVLHTIQTAILAPLVHGGEIQGVLLFARANQSGTNPRTGIGASDLNHARDFVKQASVAFTNARLYGRLETTHKRLQELDQLKDQFMITASHELRTPLTAVQGYIELVAQYDDILPADQRREFLQKAQLGCEELAVLLHNIMDASRLEAEAGIKPALIHRVNVLEIVEKVKVMIDPIATHEHRTIRIDVPAYLSVLADPLRLHQVLMNISSNALKYSPPGSPIHYTARINVENGRSVTISITDKGKGIPPEDHAQLFQRFVRLETDLNSPVRGSGLGLYISRRQVEGMGGKIWIESRGIAGEGTTFHIQLPMA